MNKNRIRGLRWRASEPMIAKPLSIKPTGGKSGGCASKVVELTSGDLRQVTEVVTEKEAIPSDHVAEVSKGQSRSCGRRSEALQSRKAEKPIGRAGNGELRPERFPRKGNRKRQ